MQNYWTRYSQIQYFGLSQILQSGLRQIARPTLKMHDNEEKDKSQGETKHL